jgi:hypothetical protein
MLPIAAFTDKFDWKPSVERPFLPTEIELNGTKFVARQQNVRPHHFEFVNEEKDVVVIVSAVKENSDGSH